MQCDSDNLFLSVMADFIVLCGIYKRIICKILLFHYDSGSDLYDLSSIVFDIYNESRVFAVLVIFSVYRVHAVLLKGKNFVLLFDSTLVLYKS